MANEDQDLEIDVEGGAGKGKSKMLIIIIAAVLLIGGGAAAFFMMGGEEEAPAETAEGEEAAKPVNKEPAIYVGVPEAITSNLPGERKSRTVQIKMTFMVRGAENEDIVKDHMPQLKNDVLMLVSQQSADELKTPDGRVKLQQQSLETVQATLKDIVGQPVVEKVLFTSFVMQ
ncbi:flagellar basal body-associated protein FliL [Aliikangiella maris]|uniref:Flagellar basal body-associated protein FliL n=2 Tax=Aliikangiella maris TaxID=3162458 RepID=A0ABV3MMW3_9GAMM